VRVDALLERVPFDRAGALAGVEARALPDVAAAVRAEILASHALVDRVYRLRRCWSLRRARRSPSWFAFTCDPLRRRGASRGEPLAHRLGAVEGDRAPPLAR